MVGTDDDEDSVRTFWTDLGIRTVLELRQVIGDSRTKRVGGILQECLADRE